MDGISGTVLLQGHVLWSLSMEAPPAPSREAAGGVGPLGWCLPHTGIRAGRQWAGVGSAGALGTLSGWFWVLLLSTTTTVTFLPVLGTAVAPVAVRDRAMVSGQSSAAVSLLQDPGPCSVPVPALPASGASGLGSQLVPAEPSTNHCLSPALPVSTELSQGCARGCDLCSEFNGCLRCSPKLFILLERNDIRQIGICLPSCPLGYFGLRNTDMNKCISECGAGRDGARAGGSDLQAVCSSAQVQEVLWLYGRGEAGLWKELSTAWACCRRGILQDLWAVFLYGLPDWQPLGGGGSFQAFSAYFPALLLTRLRRL